MRKLTTRDRYQSSLKEWVIMDIILTPFAWLIARIAVAYVFLYAAWLNTRDSASREATIGLTQLIFGFVPKQQRHKVATLCAFLGMFMMYAGGISVLLGIEGRLGALALLFISLLGIFVHQAMGEQALRDAKDMTLGPDIKEEVISLGSAAYGANAAAGLKNIVIIGICILFILNAGGNALGPWAKPWAISDMIGIWLN
jgi:uncharacterized membrane protein YphA (DoxX/SURF4 family)